MGNIDPANAAASVPGQLYYAVCAFGNTQGYQIELPPQPSRLQYKLAAAQKVLETVLELLEQQG